MTARPSLFNLKLALPAVLDDAQVGGFAVHMEGEALACSMARKNNNHRGDWTVTWLLDARPDEEKVKALAQKTSTNILDWTVEEVPDVNWLEHSYRGFPPFSVGSFFVHGSHFEENPPANQTVLCIDAATAFGSGEHGTTKGCLLVLQEIYKSGWKPQTILDMGTGSGILLIAAKKLWPNGLSLGTDIDPEAVRVAAHYARTNQITDGVRFVAGDGFAAPDVQNSAPYDLVIANILAGPLIQMAESAYDVTSGGGKILLSGLLETQAAEVDDAYRALGLTSSRRLDLDGWSTLLFTKESPKPL